MKESTKRINTIYLSLVTLLIAGGTFEGLLKLMPDSPVSGQAPMAASAPALAPSFTHDSISQTSAAAVNAPEQSAPIRVPVISTIPLDTIRVAAPKLPMIHHHKIAPSRSQSHSEAQPISAGKQEARMEKPLDLRLVPKSPELF